MGLVVLGAWILLATVAYVFGLAGTRDGRSE